MRISINYTNNKYGAFIDHVVQFIDAHPLKPNHIVIRSNAEGDISLNYEKEGEIPSQEIIFSSIVPTELYANPYVRHLESVYSVEKQLTYQEKPFHENERFGFDIIETIFFHITRFEEYHWPTEMNNQWDMMPEDKQFLVKHGLNLLPVVDQLVVQFFKALGFEMRSIKSPIILSHDIDYFSRFDKETRPLQFALSLLKRRPISLIPFAKDYFQCLISGKEPYALFESLFDEVVTKKMVYFMYGGKHRYDALPSETRTRALVSMASKAKRSGYALGLHPSYLTAKDLSLFKEEKNAVELSIGQTIVHSRQHYLHFSFSDTIPILESCFIEEDASIGYNENLGFRAGTGFRYKLFNWQKMRTSTVYEQPIAWMDSANWYSSKKQAGTYEEQAISFLKKNEFNTCISMLFHNSAWYDYQLYGVDFQPILAFMANQEII